MEQDYSKLPIEDAGKEFVTACIRNQLYNIKKILSDKRLEPYITEENFCTGFNWVAGENYDHIIEYLVFDYNIPKFIGIEFHIKLLDSEKLRKMFENRDLIQQLNSELKISSNEKIKIKV